MIGSMGWSKRGMPSRIVHMPAEPGQREQLGLGILF
jgi:hypothetical protein